MPDSPARTCPKCATAIPASFPEDLCPKCMLEQAGTVPGEAPPPPQADLDTSENTIPVAPPVSGSSPVRQMGVPSLETLRALFPDLEILDVLGAGGMGAVYKARQPRLNRLVALKIMVAAPGHETAFALRFEREAQVLARLNHPHIVILYDFGELGPERTGADPLYYFLMEFVDGTDLGVLIKSKELKPAQALAIVPQICEALQYAHDQGITHRDIKPPNILIDKNGTVKIADFGLAKMVGGGAEEAMMTGLTQTGTAMGTPHYMAPEQWEHPESVDHRVDIYALGVVFYEMLTGERPAGVFEPPSKKSRPPVDKKLDGVVMRAMDKNPERRYQQASEISRDVTRITTTSPGFFPIPEPMRRKPRLAAGFLALAGVAALLMADPLGWRKSHVRDGESKESSARVSTPPTTVNNPADSAFPPGRWVPVLKDQAELDAALLSRAGELQIRDGWTDGSSVERVPAIHFDRARFQNGGIRFRIRIADGPISPTGFEATIRQTPPNTSQAEQFGYRMRLWGIQEGGKPLVSIGVMKAGEFHSLSAMPLTQAPRAGDEYDVEFFAIGYQLIGRFDGVTLPLAKATRVEQGGFFIQQPNLIRDVELINLDGLSDAEALKIAGIDGAHPDTLQDGPPSKIVPGKVFTLDEWRESFPMFQTEDLAAPNGWFHLERDASRTVAIGNTPDVVVRGLAAIQSDRDAPCLIARVGKKGSYTLWLDVKAQKLKIGSVMLGATRVEKWFAETDVPTRIQPGDEVLMEFRIEGSHLTAKLDEKLLIEAEDGEIQTTGGWGMKAKGEGAWFKSAEVVRLGVARSNALALAPDKIEPSASASPTWAKVNWTGQTVSCNGQPDRLLTEVDVRRDGGMRLVGEEQWTSTTVPGIGAFQNGGIRFRWKPHRTGKFNFNFTVAFRGTRGPSVNIGEQKCSIYYDLRRTPDGKLDSSGRLGSVAHGGLPPAGEEVLMEFYCIGRRMMVKRDGELLITQDLPALDPAGTLRILGDEAMVITELELINLDGVTEAKALKVLGMESVVPTIAAAPDSAAGPPAALPSKPGRLRAAGFAPGGAAPDLSKVAQLTDLVDVGGRVGGWVVLRSTGESISLKGDADFTGIAKIGGSIIPRHVLVGRDGKLRFSEGPETLPAAFDEAFIVDAEIGQEHGIALTRDGRALVFGNRYLGQVADPTQSTGFGTPKWPPPPPEALTNVKDIAVTQTHAATLKHDGTLSVFGWEGLLELPTPKTLAKIEAIESETDQLLLLDAKGQTWKCLLPRNPHPDQPIAGGGKLMPNRSLGETGITAIQGNCWRSADGTWKSSSTYIQPLLASSNVGAASVIVDSEGYFQGDRFDSLLWIEPVEDEVAATIPSPAVAAMKQRGGRLRTWGEPGTVDLSRAEGIDDFAQFVCNGAGWAAFRVSGEVISANDSMHGKKNIVAGHAAGLINDQGTLLWRGQTWGDVQDFDNAMEHVIIIHQNGGVEIVVEPDASSPVGFREGVLDRLAQIQDARAVAFHSARYTGAILHADGTATCWSHPGEIQQPPAHFRDLTAVAVGNSAWLGLKTDGTVVAWGTGGDDSQALLNVPAFDHPVIAIRAAKGSAAAQLSTGEWVGWGDNSSGVVDQIQAIGKAVDLQFQGLGQGLLWIEPVE